MDGNDGPLGFGGGCPLLDSGIDVLGACPGAAGDVGCEGAGSGCLLAAAVAAGESCRSVATIFRVSVASVVKWSQRFRVTGSAAAHKVGGRRP